MAEPEEAKTEEQEEREAYEEQLKSFDVPYHVLWNEEAWWTFHAAARLIYHMIETSRGVAERTLRELCAKGDIRSIRYDDAYTDPDMEEFAVEPEFIRPSEWLGKELDLEAKYPHVIAVSQDDVLYWIDKQPNKRLNERPKTGQRLTLAEFIASSRERQPQTNPPIKERMSRKRALVDKAINALWQGGVPGTVSNSILVHHVGNWLTDHCKRENSPKPEISGDTILRAAGRK